MSKFIEIPFSRTCGCKPNHINCLSAKEWIKCQIGVWKFNYEKRDIRDKKIHPAVFPISLANRVISLFSHEGELVLDPFVGSGTTLVAASDLYRNAVGFDLNQGYIDFASNRLVGSESTSTAKQLVIADDARNIQKYFKNDQVSLIFSSPPYANLLNRKRKNKSRRGKQRKNDQYLKIEQYSQDPRDLGILEPNEFANAISEIYRNLLPLLKPKGHCVIFG